MLDLNDPNLRIVDWTTFEDEYAFASIGANVAYKMSVGAGCYLRIISEQTTRNGEEVDTIIDLFDENGNALSNADEVFNNVVLSDDFIDVSDDDAIRYEGLKIYNISSAEKIVYISFRDFDAEEDGEEYATNVEVRRYAEQALQTRVNGVDIVFNDGAHPDSVVLDFIERNFGENLEQRRFFIVGRYGLSLAKHNGEYLSLSNINDALKDDLIDLIEGVSEGVERATVGVATLDRAIASIQADIAEIKRQNAEIDIDALSAKVLENIEVRIVDSDGIVITKELLYDSANDKYVLNYDTSLLDGRDYTIELALR